MDDDLRRYIEEDAARWYAVHGRITALAGAVSVVAIALQRATPEVTGDIMAGLRVYEQNLVEDGAHPAALSEVRQLQQMLFPHPKDATG